MSLGAALYHRRWGKDDESFVIIFLPLENRVQWEPYDICGGAEDDVYYMTEPWINRVSMVRMKIKGQDEPSGAELLGAVGGRRDNAGPAGAASQFNAVASAKGMKRKGKKPASTPAPDLPLYLKYNPVQREWQILQTGQVLFRDTFKYYEYRRQQLAFTPSDVALDSKRRLFVCDQYNSAIRLFDSDGNVLWSFGQEGYCDNPDADWDKFLMPTSMSIDDDHLVVSDPVNRVMKIFKIDTKKDEDCLEYVAGIRCFQKTPEEGMLWCPFFIHASEGRVYVPDSTRNVVNVYSYRSS